MEDKHSFNTDIRAKIEQGKQGVLTKVKKATAKTSILFILKSLAVVACLCLYVALIVEMHHYASHTSAWGFLLMICWPIIAGIYVPIAALLAFTLSRVISMFLQFKQVPKERWLKYAITGGVVIAIILEAVVIIATMLLDSGGNISYSSAVIVFYVIENLILAAYFSVYAFLVYFLKEEVGKLFPELRKSKQDQHSQPL